MPVIHWNCLLCLSPNSGQGLLFGGQRQNSRWQMCRVALPQPGADGHWGRKVFGVAWWGCVCVHVWSSVFFSAMYSFISPSCWQKTLVVPMSRQVWEAVAPPEGALLEDNCVVVSAEGDCNSNMAGSAGPQPVIDLGICQCLDAITVRSSC